MIERDRLLQYPTGGGERGRAARHRHADGRGDPAPRRRPQGARGLGRCGHAHASGSRPLAFYALAAFFTLFVLFLYGPMSAIYILSFQGPTGGLTFPMRGVSLDWFDALFGQQRTGDFAGSFWRSIALAVVVLVLTLVISVAAGLAFRRRFSGVDARSSIWRSPACHAGPARRPRHRRSLFQFLGLTPNWYSSGARRASDLDAAVRPPDHVRRLQPLQPRLRGGGARPRRQPAGRPFDT